MPNTNEFKLKKYAPLFAIPLSLCLSLSGVTTVVSAQTKKAIEHLPTTYSHKIPFTIFSGSNITFSYPSSWAKKGNDDKDQIVKLGGKIKDSIAGEMTVSKYADENVTPEELKTTLGIYLKKLTNYKVLQEKNIAFGRSRKQNGILQDIFFEMNGMPINQRIVFFEGPNGAYTCTFLSVKNHFNEAAKTFNRILLSFSFTGGSANRTSNVARKETNNLKAKFAPISMSYPSGWKIEEGGGDKVVEITGTNKDGKHANITMFKGQMHPWWTLNNVVTELEKKHLETQPKFRKLNSNSKTFGSGAKITGVVQECQFESGGVPCKQLVAYFNDKTHAYVLCMTSTNWKLSNMRHAFHKVLSSLRFND